MSDLTLEQAKAALAGVKDPATGRELLADGRAELSLGTGAQAELLLKIDLGGGARLDLGTGSIAVK